MRDGRSVRVWELYGMLSFLSESVNPRSLLPVLVFMRCVEENACALIGLDNSRALAKAVSTRDRHASGGRPTGPRRGRHTSSHQNLVNRGHLDVLLLDVDEAGDGHDGDHDY